MWCALSKTKYTATLLKQYQATNSTIITIIIDYTVKSMIPFITIAIRHLSSNQTFDSLCHWRSFPKFTLSYIKSMTANDLHDL